MHPNEKKIAKNDVWETTFEDEEKEDKLDGGFLGRGRENSER